MTTVEFTINDAVQAATRRFVFVPEQKALLKKTFEFQNVEVYEEEEVQDKGPLGHYVMQPLRFDRFSYEQTDSTGKRRIQLDSLYLPLVMIELSREKNIEMTPVEGKDGTVKEYGSHGDHVATVKGIILGDGAYPSREVDGLKAYEDVQVAVPVSNPMMNRLLIFNVVIKNLRWVPMEGVQHAQAFEFTAYEDVKTDLKLLGE